ncbi:alpha/beta fold hydrolase [Phenylobacterium sp.]|uniref:alpha/beta fold hydrolase n=1 Tax=Phenylobacterium sp. TaxID=1871053 RepID=UPI002734EA76|nr:alpha/beta hydrolase [Phenylobacterium sp.]MDP3855726.1 alpha/beta hydrolase [Phenylobacterium sp.]
MFRASVIVALLLGLAACGRDEARAPFAESRVPPSLGARFQPPEGWAWGFIRTGLNPVQRYGVASTSRVPRAIVVITPGYGESAEVWFETVRDLVAEGYTVWILDRAGQGGSERFVLPRDLGHAPNFDPDVTGLMHLLKVVVRAPDETPVVLLGHADGAVVALAAVEAGLRVDGVIASSPWLEPGVAPSVALPGVNRLPPPGWRSWTRDGPDDLARKHTHDPWRGAVGQAWQTANPDLRMSGPSRGWTAAHRTMSRKVANRAASARTSILMLNPGSESASLCARAPECRTVPIAAARRALHLEADPWRGIWRTEVLKFIASAVSARRVNP